MIRRMQAEDLEEVAALEKEIFSEPWSKKSFEDSMKSETNIYLVEWNQGVQGYCGLWGAAGEGQICNVAVRKEARGQGIAFRLLTELMAEGERQGLTAFTLEVREGNQPALAVYHRLGFKEAGIRKNFYTKPTEDAIIMWHYLENDSNSH